MFSTELVIPTREYMAIYGFSFGTVIVKTLPLDNLTGTTTLGGDDGTVMLSVGHSVESVFF